VKIIIVSLLASCSVTLAQSNTDGAGYVTNANLLKPFTLTNSTGDVITNAVLVKLMPNNFIYKTPSGEMGTKGLNFLPKDWQERIGYVLQPAMVALGDEFYKKWQNEFSDFLSTNEAPIDPKTGLPNGTITATNSVNYNKCMEWYEKAATLGDTNAMWKIIEHDEASDVAGDRVSPETGLPMRKEALRWLKILAEKGDASATRLVRDCESRINFDSQINSSLSRRNFTN